MKTQREYHLHLLERACVFPERFDPTIVDSERFIAPSYRIGDLVGLLDGGERIITEVTMTELCDRFFHPSYAMRVPFHANKGPNTKCAWFYEREISHTIHKSGVWAMEEEA